MRDLLDKYLVAILLAGVLVAQIATLAAIYGLRKDVDDVGTAVWRTACGGKDYADSPCFVTIVPR